MGLDIRLPIGLMFTLLGLMLAIWGVIADPSIYERSLGHNVNLVWGIVLFIFGAILLWLARKRSVDKAG
jgi:multisubunit Na+/H+ antiporter MnhG subunit